MCIASDVAVVRKEWRDKAVLPESGGGSIWRVKVMMVKVLTGVSLTRLQLNPHSALCFDPSSSRSSGEEYEDVHMHIGEQRVKN